MCVCALRHSTKVIQHYNQNGHLHTDQWVSKHILAYDSQAPLPVQSSCQALKLRGMVLCSVDKVASSSFGHLHDQIIHVAPEFASPQKEFISVMVQLLHGEVQV